jgi:hypothetical protein
VINTSGEAVLVGCADSVEGVVFMVWVDSVF